MVIIVMKILRSQTTFKLTKASKDQLDTENSAISIILPENT